MSHEIRANYQPRKDGKILITGSAELTPWSKGVILQGHRAVEDVRIAATEDGSGQHMVLATRSRRGGIDRRQINIDFLRDAAAAYHISPDPRDYVFVSLPIVTAGVPNRNMDCFTHKELLRFSPIIGRRVYQTFIGKPTHQNHKNQDPTKAKGIHLDATFRKYRVQPGSLGYDAQTEPVDLWKVRILTAWCREKDPELVKSILRRERTGYSMGALVDYALCSLPWCGKVTTPQPCEHVAAGKGRVARGHIVYDRVYGVNFIETSVLDEEPADPDAWETDAIWSVGTEAA